MWTICFIIKNCLEANFANPRIFHASFITSLTNINSDLGNFIHSERYPSPYSIFFHPKSIILNVLVDLDIKWLMGLNPGNDFSIKIHKKVIDCEIQYVKEVLYLQIFEESTTSRIINFQFVSPTSFRQKKRQIINPDPRLIFNSLLTRWNCFSNLSFQFPDEYFADILWNKFNFRTEMWEMTNYKIKGFLGNGSIKLWETIPKEYCKMLNCLADYAEYSGVGYKTTMGFGEVRRI